MAKPLRRFPPPTHDATPAVDLTHFQNRLGHCFQDASLLKTALTHPSVAHEHGNTSPSNQRLEFLGDAVLGMVLSLELYKRFPDVGEGPLTKARAQMVNSRALADLGRRLALGDHLILSRGEESTGGRQRDSALADAFEALAGAVFLDGGLEAARALVLRFFGDQLAESAAPPNLDNPKGELQEMLQSAGTEAPQYEMVSSTGPDHDRVFEYIVRHGGKELGRGTGKSKKAAESEAANAALKLLREEADSRKATHSVAVTP